MTTLATHQSAALARAEIRAFLAPPGLPPHSATRRRGARYVAGLEAPIPGDHLGAPGHRSLPAFGAVVLLMRGLGLDLTARRGSVR